MAGVWDVDEARKIVGERLASLGWDP